MFTEEALIVHACNKCGNEIRIRRVWHPGGANDYGSLIVRCDKCGEICEINIGRDVYESDVLSGATLLERKDRD